MVLDCSCLASAQEEADTRILLHTLYSDKLYQENNVQGRIVVKSPDTDVLVLLVHYFPNMKNPRSFYSRQFTKLIGWLIQSFEHRVLPDTKERRSGITPS
jgi:hypothetical protein